MQFTKTALLTAVVGALAVTAAPAPSHKRGHSGVATWYTQDGTTGSCGTRHSDSAHIIAVASSYGSSLCGKTVTIKHGSKSIQATVADSCPSCSAGHIDLSRGAFGKLASYEQGEINVDWYVS